jgi:tRNA(Ile)-lysidine synthase
MTEDGEHFLPSPCALPPYVAPIRQAGTSPIQSTSTPDPAALTPVSSAEFAQRLDALGPFEPSPHLAVAVSGGADSLALAALAHDWAAQRGGHVTGLIVDHGLRDASPAEAAHAAAELARLGIDAHVLPLAGLSRGPGLAARARAARYAALEGYCARGGILHLLLGHHRADQAETLTIRRHAGSGRIGLAGMAALVETTTTRWLRPLLDIPPGRLRATLRAIGLTWIEDPSNADLASQRARVRAAFADPSGDGPAIHALLREARAHGVARTAVERAAARWLTGHAEIRPEGYALLGPGPWDPIALAGLLRMLAGAVHPPPPARVAALAAVPRAGTLGGVRIMPAGRWLAGGWLLAREEAAMAPPVAAAFGTTWDGRFRVVTASHAPYAMLGPTRGTAGDATPDAAAMHRRVLPAAVLRTLPPPCRDRELLEVQHLSTERWFVLAPPGPAACAPFAPMQAGCYAEGCGSHADTLCSTRRESSHRASDCIAGAIGLNGARVAQGIK